MKNTKAELFYPFWSVAIVLCMVIALFSLIFASCADGSTKPKDSGKTESEQAESSDPADETSDSETVSPPNDNQASDTIPTAARLAETDDMGQSYIDRFKFLGDSTTYGLVHHEVAPSSQVWTPANGTLTLSLWSTATIVDRESDSNEIPITDIAATYKPEYLIITLGLNGVSFMDEAYFKEVYTNLVNAIKEASPDTKIILNSIYPISAKYPESNLITNPKIDAANTWVETIASETDVKYLDSASALKDATGALPEKYQSDNIHLNKDGYNVVINYIRTHGWQ